MDIEARSELGHAGERVFAAIADLRGYPSWLTIVREVVEAPGHDGELGPAWWVELEARLGPVRRTKQVRMVRTRHAPPTQVRFERDERDGQRHSAWVLAGTIESTGADASTLTMRLHYSGAPWLPGIDRVLRQEIRRAGSRLDAVLG